MCQSPDYPSENKMGNIYGNLSVLMDGVLGQKTFRIRYYPKPVIDLFPSEDHLYVLQGGEDKIEITVSTGLPYPRNLSRKALQPWENEN